MMLADIKSEHGGSLQLNSLSLTPVRRGYRCPGGAGRASGERGVGTRAPVPGSIKHGYP